MTSNYSDHSPAAAIAAAEQLSPLSSWLSPAASTAAASTIRCSLPLQTVPEPNYMLMK